MRLHPLTRVGVAASLASTLFLAGALVVGGSAVSAQAAGHATVTLSPSSGNISDLGASGTGNYTLSTDLVCPVNGTEESVLAVPPITSAPLRDGTSDTAFDHFQAFGAFAKVTGGAAIPDSTTLFPGDPTSGIPDWLNPAATAWFDSAAGATTGLDTFLKPSTSYSLGVVCATAGTPNSVPDPDDPTVEMMAWSTLTVDADGNWTLSDASAPPSTAVDTATSISATLDSNQTSADLSATVSKAGETDPATDATGSVQFFEGTSTVGDPVTVTDGVASLSPSPTLSGGSHTFTAQFTPDTPGAALYNGSTSSASPAVTVPGTSKTNTSVAITASLQGTTGTALVTATITKAGGSGATTDASGTVQFADGGTSIGSAVSESNGVATLTTPVLSSGDHAFSATYVPDSAASSTYNGSSTTSTASVTVPSTPTILTDGGTVTPGDDYEVDAPTGTFTDGDTIAGEIHSDPISLSETATAAADGSATYVFTAPASLVAGDSHELLLTGTPSTNTFTVDFTVAGAGTGTGTGDTNPNDPSSFATGLVASMVSTPSGVAGLFGILVVLALLAVGAWTYFWRRRRQDQREAS